MFTYLIMDFYSTNDSCLEKQGTFTQRHTHTHTHTHTLTNTHTLLLGDCSIYSPCTGDDR